MSYYAMYHCESNIIGIVNFSDDAENVDALLQKVDRAMYQSRNSGRNAVTLYSEHE